MRSVGSSFFSFFSSSALLDSSGWGLLSCLESCLSIRFWRLSSFSSKPFSLTGSPALPSKRLRSLTLSSLAVSAWYVESTSATARPTALASSLSSAFFIGIIFPCGSLWLKLTATPSFWTSFAAAALYFSFSSSLATVTSNLVPLNSPMIPFGFNALTFISTILTPSSLLALSSASSFVLP